MPHLGADSGGTQEAWRWRWRWKVEVIHFMMPMHPVVSWRGADEPLFVGKGERRDSGNQDAARGKTMWAELQSTDREQAAGFRWNSWSLVCDPQTIPFYPPSAPKDARFERLACLCRPFSSNPSTCHPVEFPACDPSEVWPRCCRYPGPHSCADGLALGQISTLVYRCLAVHPWAFFSLFPPSRMQGARIRAVL